MPRLRMPEYNPELNDLHASWRDEARCAELVKDYPSWAELWDATEAHDPDSKAAAQLCSSCPVRRECVMDAILDTHSQGVRAGVIFIQGRVSAAGNAALKKEFKVTGRSRKSMKLIESADVA